MSSKTLGACVACFLTALAVCDNRKEGHSITENRADVHEILGGSYDAALQIVRWLVDAGWLARLTAGRYAIVPLSSGDESTPQVNRYVIAREILDETPYYISHDSAMDIYNVLTRPVTTVVVTTPQHLADRDIPPGR